MNSSFDKVRPRYLNLFKIRLPITGIVSITHRLTGVFMILCVAVCAYLLEMSLHSAKGFETATSMIENPGVRIFLGLGLFSISHHLFAGIRYLLFDIDIGIEKASAKKAAWFVVIADVVALVFIAGWCL